MLLVPFLINETYLGIGTNRRVAEDKRESESHLSEPFANIFSLFAELNELSAENAWQ